MPLPDFPFSLLVKEQHLSVASLTSSLEHHEEESWGAYPMVITWPSNLYPVNSNYPACPKRSHNEIGPSTLLPFNPLTSSLQWNWFWCTLYSQLTVHVLIFIPCHILRKSRKFQYVTGIWYNWDRSSWIEEIMFKTFSLAYPGKTGLACYAAFHWPGTVVPGAGVYRPSKRLPLLCDCKWKKRDEKMLLSDFTCVTCISGIYTPTVVYGVTVHWGHVLHQLSVIQTWPYLSFAATSRCVEGQAHDIKQLSASQSWTIPGGMILCRYHSSPAVILLLPSGWTFSVYLSALGICNCLLCQLFCPDFEWHFALKVLPVLQEIVQFMQDVRKVGCGRIWSDTLMVLLSVTCVWSMLIVEQVAWAGI